MSTYRVAVEEVVYYEYNINARNQHEAQVIAGDLEGYPKIPIADSIKRRRVIVAVTPEYTGGIA